MVPHILLVDDDPTCLELISKTVESLGYTFDAVVSAEEALEKLESERYHVMVTDIRMPGMNGVDLIEEAARRTPNMLSIAVSGDSTSDEIVSAMKQHRAYDYIFKPFHREMLRGAIDRAFEVHRLRMKSASFEENEIRFFRDLVETLDWKEELRNRNLTNIAWNMVRQLNIGFFHGSGLGSLISSNSMLIRRARSEDGGKTYTIPGELLEIVRENHAVTQRIADSLADTQAILMAKEPYSETIAPAELPEFLERCRLETASSLAIKNQRLAIGSLPAGAQDRRIVFNKDKMFLALEELIINACKYSGEYDTIFVLIMIKPAHLEIKILNPAYQNEDGTVGITGRNENLIFEPFFRLSSVADERFERERFGQGLGLAIVKKILDLHNANIFANTIKNYAMPERSVDVCFSMRFPLPGRKPETVPETIAVEQSR